MKKNINYILKIFVTLALATSILIPNIQVFAHNIPSGGTSTDLETIRNEYPELVSMIEVEKTRHPNFEFELFNTGIDWNQFINFQYDAGNFNNPRNLIESNNFTRRGLEWLSPERKAETFDKSHLGDNSGRWKAPSIEAIKYYVDPRTYFARDAYFAFARQDNYQTALNKEQVVNTINNALNSNLALKQAFKNQGETIYAVASKLNLHPFSVTTFLIQENGVVGQLDGVTYYNPMNIGATGGSSYENGLKYAKEKGWNTFEKGLEGGAGVIKRYIDRGQVTEHSKKFDYVAGIGWNQYMQNIEAPIQHQSYEKRNFEKIDPGLQNRYVFRIPLFNNMPKYASPIPSPQLAENETIGEITTSVGIKVRILPTVKSEHVTTLPYDSRFILLQYVDAQDTESSIYKWAKIRIGQDIRYMPTGDSEGSWVRMLDKQKTRVKLPSLTNTLVYNGSVQTALLTELDEKYITVTDNKATNAGQYTLKLALKDKEKTVWDDGSIDDKTITWNIAKKTGIMVDIVGNEKTSKYTGNMITLTGYQAASSESIYTENDFVAENIPTISQKEPGIYLMNLTENNFRNTNNNFENVKFNIVADGKLIIQEKQQLTLKVPTVANQLTFTGEEQELLLTNFDESLMSIENNKATNAGLYQAKITLKNTEITKWEDGTKEPKNIAWKIAKKEIVIPEKLEDFKYNSLEQELKFKNLDKNFVNVTNNKYTEIGTYTAILSLKDTVNTTWIDKTIENKNIVWNINKPKVKIPNIITNYIYDTTLQQLELNNYDELLMTIENDKAKDAGTYKAKVSLKDTTHYVWEDDTTDAKEITWYINKKEGVIVNIIGNSKTEIYDGKEKQIEGYIVNIDDSIYLKDDFKFEGQAIAKGTEIGKYEMNLQAKNFKNLNSNFDRVTFKITNGVLNIKNKEEEVKLVPNPNNKENKTNNNIDTNNNQNTPVNSNNNITRNTQKNNTSIANSTINIQAENNINNTKIEEKVNTYKVLNGENQKFNPLKLQKISFRIDASSEALKKVFLDGAEISKENYEITKETISDKSGSTIITLKDEFARKLSEGTHNLKLEYLEDKTVKIAFIIENKADKNILNAAKSIDNNKNTDNKIKTNSDTVIYIGIGIISIIVLGIGYIIFKKENN